jgi:hypothetical protein
MSLMTDDEQGASGPLPSLVQEFTSRLRESTERLHSLTRLGGRLPSAAGPLPLPGALSAAQLTAVVDSSGAASRR